MAKKIYAVDSIVGGYVFSWIAWPQIRNALMESLFCNEFYAEGSARAFELFGGSCNYAFILLFVIPGIYTGVKVLVYAVKFYNWVQDMRG